jgi:hypothetical protein
MTRTGVGLQASRLSLKALSSLGKTNLLNQQKNTIKLTDFDYEKLGASHPYTGAMWLTSTFLLLTSTFVVLS